MIGRTLSHYRIVGQLGAGGMGVVYSAEDTRLGRQVALKFVSSDFAHDEQAIMRLRSEARAASALNHPNICTIYDVGEDDGHPFIVMELMKGQSLRERLNAGPLKVQQVVDIGIEIADALQAAHAEGIIHRDIKPGNIFITERGHVKILDFGLAKLTTSLTSATTIDTAPQTSATGVTHGTPAYMSPEQATGEPLDGRTDLFSLGVVLYECATGHHPFPGKTSAVVLAGILDRSPASPLMYNPDLPVRLHEIISNALEKDRELRYQSAADLRADLRRLRRDLGSGGVRAIERSTEALATSARSGSQRSGLRAPEPTLEAGQVARTTQTLEQARSTRGWVWGGVGAALAVAAAVAAFVLWPSEPATPPAQQEAPSAAAPAPPPSPPVAPTISVDNQMRSAEASLKAGNYRSALATAREVLALDPSHEGAARIRDEATAALARFDEAIEDARRRIAAGDVQGAARALELARGIDAASPSVVELGVRLAAVAREQSARAAAAARPAEPRSTPSEAAKPEATAEKPPSATSQPGTAPSTPTQPLPKPMPAPPPVEAEPPPAPPPSRPVEPVPTPSRPPATAKEPPVTKEPAAPAKPSVDDDTLIRRVIANYGRAIETKDLALFRAIKPNLTPEEERRLQAGFRAVTSQKVALSIVSIERSGDRATVVVTRRDTIEAGGRQQTNESKQVLTLSRMPGGWVIVEIG